MNYHDFPHQPLSAGHLVLQYLKIVKRPVTLEELREVFPTRIPQRNDLFVGIPKSGLKHGTMKEIWSETGKAWEITPYGVSIVYQIGNYLSQKRELED